ncbi:MAG: hypothetical protein IJX64_07550 [Clostridia bacterium]|nr:hypothetical protein [Clostridia bacterium]
MKKFIIIVSCVVCLVLLFHYLYYYQGCYIDFSPNTAVTTFVRTENDKIYLDRGDGYREFEIKGVDLGSGVPGKWSTDFAASKEDYLRWFALIREMGANTIRVYTIHDDAFYDAFYAYNIDNPEPLYLLHGVWVNDYLYNSRKDAFDDELLGNFVRDCKRMVDVIHGNRKIPHGSLESAGSGTYTKDISQWVIGYILGVEWEDVMVVYTNEKFKNNDAYHRYYGKYMYTTEDATPFEAMLARVGDSIIEYESERYKVQKLVAFSNWPITDPFTYPDYLTDFFHKCARVDVEHIGCTEAFLSGQFASYHIYPYYRDYLAYVTDFSALDFDVDVAACLEDGVLNTYKLYLKAIADHHRMPVIISEFGIPTGRGIAHVDVNTGRDQGHMSETEQGKALVECYNDIMEAGCAGSCLFSWQDEWFKRTWNTNYAVDLARTPYWSDMQTNEQYFGLLAFDPGEETSVCYVDGNVSEWGEEDIVAQSRDMSLSMQYDEAAVYFLIRKEDLDFENETLYIPVDVTPKSGSSYCENYGLLFDRAADFVIVIDGKSNSRILVQERYEVLRANYAQSVYGFDTYVKGNIPDVDSPKFVDVDMILQLTQLQNGAKVALAEVFPTGRLTYGNADPDSEDYTSLADFICSGDHVEIRIPWALLNFSDPSHMQIHDDYYDGNYGIEAITVDSIYVGIASDIAAGRIHLAEKKMQGWGNDVTYHERLKPAYYVMKGIWGNDE